MQPKKITALIKEAILDSSYKTVILISKHTIF